MSTNKDTGHHSEYVPLEDQKIINVEINKEMRKSFLDYSMSVIVSRALPDVRDGLKPVHRRILYTMYENGLYPEKAYRKCADTVGSVLGRYHPHGDASVYDAMVRLAQDFSMRYPLVDGHGNFGSVDGDPPAAYRYTESRMSKISMEMLTNLDKDTVDMMRNYDDRLNEPVVLPSRFPNLLVNGSTGIAVGMATNIPPHNMREVIDGICCLIDNPDATLEDIMEHIKGPDFPTAGIIMGRAGIRAAYATGRGKVTLRARAEIVENEKNGRFKIVVTELPYQVNKARLIESIAELVKDKRIEGISDINDYSSDRAGMRMEIDLKRDANPQVILNQLYSYTQLQISYGIIQLAIVDGEPKILTLKQILEKRLKNRQSFPIRALKTPRQPLSPHRPLKNPPKRESTLLPGSDRAAKHPRKRHKTRTTRHSTPWSARRRCSGRRMRRLPSHTRLRFSILTMRSTTRRRNWPRESCAGGTSCRSSSGSGRNTRRGGCMRTFVVVWSGSFAMLRTAKNHVCCS